MGLDTAMMDWLGVGCGVDEGALGWSEDEDRVGKCVRTTSIAVPSTSQEAVVAVGRANRRRALAPDRNQ